MWYVYANLNRNGLPDSNHAGTLFIPLKDDTSLAVRALRMQYRGGMRAYSVRVCGAAAQLPRRAPVAPAGPEIVNALNYLPPFPLQPSLLALFGVLLLAGLIGGELVKRLLHLPRITGYVLMGMLLGASGFRLLDSKLIAEAWPLHTVFPLTYHPVPDIA